MTHEIGPGAGCIVCERVLNGAPILYAMHDEPLDGEDSGWQFLCGSDDHGDDGKEDGAVACIDAIVENEPQLQQFVRQPVGAELERASEFHVFERMDVPEPVDGEFVCSYCTETHSGLPMDFSADAPDYYDEAAADDWSIDGATAVWRHEGEEIYFYHGLLQIPVVDGPCSFQFAVWVTVSPENFPIIQELMGRENGVEENGTGGEGSSAEATGPFFGWLSTRLPGYPDTINLKLNGWFVPGSELPLFTLEPTDHPLSIDHRTGVDMQRVHAMIADYS